MKRFIGMMVVMVFAFSFAHALNADDVLGEYYTPEKKATIKVYKCGDKYCGKIIALKNPNKKDGTPKVDDENPDVTKRTRPIVGLKLVWRFKFKNDKWVDGQIYDPESGKTYFCKLNFLDNELKKLKVRGSLGRVGMLGKTQIWIRK